MQYGTVKWFNDAKGFGSSPRKTAAPMCSCITRRSAPRASAACRKASGQLRRRPGPEGRPGAGVVPVA
jgi:hypothetical protein